VPRLKFDPDENLREAVQAIDRARLLLYPILEEKVPEAAPKNGGKAEWDGENRVLKFTFPDVPPPLFSRYTDLADYWRGMVARAFFSSGLNERHISFEYAFVLIVIMYSNHAFWDPDNRAIKPIIDAIRRLRLVSDDDWKHVTFMVTGKPGNGSVKTEVYVTDWRNMISILEMLDVKNWRQKSETLT
jgi:hypothetical protein